MSVDGIVDAVYEAMKKAGADDRLIQSVSEFLFAVSHHAITKNSGSFEVHFDVNGKVAHCEHHEKKRLAQNFKG